MLSDALAHNKKMRKSAADDSRGNTARSSSAGESDNQQCVRGVGTLPAGLLSRIRRAFKRNSQVMNKGICPLAAARRK